jgi:hypothetical protein
MNHTPDDLSRLCHGLAHEFSNILTYLIPAISESAQCFHMLSSLLAAPQEPEDPALRRLRAEFSPADLARIERQLQLAGGRLSLIFRDLRLCGASSGPGVPVDLHAALCQVLPDMGAGIALPPIEVLEPPAPVLVHADPSLLGEALSRLLRAAVGWARTLHPPAGVQIRLEPRQGMAHLIIALRGDKERLPSPECLLDMLCPSENGAERAERGLLGVLIAGRLLRLHGGTLSAGPEDAEGGGGVALYAQLPLSATSQ